MSDDGSLEQRNAELSKRVGKLGAAPTVASLAVSMRRVRIQNAILTASLALDLFLSIITLFLYIKLDHVVRTANANSDSIYNTCLSSNEARATELTLWNFVIDQPRDPAAPPQTASEKAEIAQFKNLLNTTLAQRDCTKVVSP